MINQIKIPTEICQWALTNREIPLLKVYLYFLFKFSGKVKLTRKDFNKLSHDLGYNSTKQPKKYLKKLLLRNWIGYNNTSKYYFIRGLDPVRSIEGFYRQSAIQMKYKDLKHLREFCFSSVLENLIKNQKKRGRVIGA